MYAFATTPAVRARLPKVNNNDFMFSQLWEPIVFKMALANFPWHFGVTVNMLAYEDRDG